MGDPDRVTRIDRWKRIDDISEAMRATQERIAKVEKMIDRLKKYNTSLASQYEAEFKEYTTLQTEENKKNAEIFREKLNVDRLPHS